MTLKAKTIIRAFYGKDSQRSYFEGGSGGGRQALMEAQRYPEDYDGIIAGCPPINLTHHAAGFVWDLQATQNDPASYIPASKIPAISAAVVEACDAADGYALLWPISQIIWVQAAQKSGGLSTRSRAPDWS